MSSVSERWQNVYIPDCTIIGDAVRYTFLEWICGVRDTKNTINLHKKQVIVDYKNNLSIICKEVGGAIILYSNRTIPDCSIYFPPEKSDVQILDRKDEILQRMIKTGKTKWLYFLDAPYERESEILEIRDLIKQQNRGLLVVIMKSNMITASTDLDTSEDALISAHRLFDSYNIPWIDAESPKDVTSILCTYEEESITVFRKLKTEEDILNNRIFCIKYDVQYMLEDERLDAESGLLSAKAREHIFYFRKIQKYHSYDFAEALVMSANEWLCKGQRNIPTIAGDLLRSVVEDCPLFDSLCGEELILKWVKELADNLQIEIMSLLQHTTCNINLRMPQKESEYLSIMANGIEQRIWNEISNSIDIVVEHSIIDELKKAEKKLKEIEKILVPDKN